MERVSDVWPWPFMPRGTYLKEPRVMASRSLYLLSSVRRNHSYFLGMTAPQYPTPHLSLQPQARSEAPTSPVTRTSAVRQDTQRKTNRSATTASVRVQLNLLPLPSSTCVLQALAGSPLGTGPATVTETHDSFVICTSQMTSIQHSRLPFISLLFFIFAFCFCHPILVFKGPYCACL